MSRNKKPRRPYRPRHVCLDTLALAAGNMAKPSAADRQHLQGMVAAAVKALREGVATEQQWSIVAGAVELGKAVERKGVVRGLAGHLAHIEQALQAINRRAMSTGTWRPTAMYFQELDALQMLLDLYKFQLAQLSRQEVQQAAHLATHRVNSMGGTATLAKTPEQLELMGVAA